MNLLLSVKVHNKQYFMSKYKWNSLLYKVWKLLNLSDDCVCFLTFWNLTKFGQKPDQDM